MTSGQSLVSSPLDTSSPAVAAPTPASSSALAPSQPSQLPIRKPGSYFHLAAGLASGLTSSLLLQPADLLKTRVQQSPTSSIRSVIKTIASTPHPLKQLWRGTLPSAIRTSVGSALYFATLNKVRSTLATSNGRIAGASGSSSLPKLSPGLNLLAGAGARAAVGFIMMPITVVKVRWESSLYQYRSLSAAVKDIVKERGARGLFAGFGATALRDAPYAGLYVVVYEWGKNTLSALSTSTTDADKSLKATTSASINFVSGGLAAATATAATNPPDAVKTRLQLMPSKYRNTWQAASLMLKEEGVRSMFDGLGLRMTRKALSSALAWTVYEEFVRRAQKRLYD